MVISKSINIELCNSNEEIISSIRNLISNKYDHLFVAVIAHGSFGTNEIIRYSDFDGLIIVKDEFADSDDLTSFKKESMRFLLKFDPLQHHGWFQIKESQLKNYPQFYLPYEVLNHSKLIYPILNNIEINLTFNSDNVDYKRSLKQLINSIENHSSSESMRLYELKSFLSKVMLLPTMYYSAKMNKGLFKKDSFTVVKGDFSSQEWNCIETASEIRSHWSYSLSAFQNLIMTRPEIIFRRLTKKFVSPKVSNEINKKLNPAFYKSLKLFIKKINKDIFAN
ncbi:hypothetical protein [Psychroserpens sp.]|uniref:nucleotidyltransferase domain-containing protein n=1 Tax=Psychroserpens sp. TaxID=2020870 RepID=UPI00385D94B7